MHKYFIIVSVIIFSFVDYEIVISQPLDNSVIKNSVEKYKKDARGPYKDIRWFCKDGSIVPPDKKCPEPGGVQRARYKNEVELLAKTNKIFLGQILSTTSLSDFWDEQNENSRLKQYIIEKYLKSIDNGWILRRAQYYRGAYQAEDEENWGIEFYKWILGNDEFLSRQYYLIRESLKNIPHQGDNNILQNIRSISKNISDEYPPFMDIRVKIHGQPDITDLSKVKSFKEKNRTKLNSELLKKFDELISDMEIVYKPVDLNLLSKHLKNISGASNLKDSISIFIKKYSQKNSIKGIVSGASNLIWQIRKDLLKEKLPKGRLALLDISIKLENIVFIEIDNWEISSIEGLLSKNYSICKAIAGAGLIEIWEWEYLQSKVIPQTSKEISLGNLKLFLDNSRRIVEWGSGMVRSCYQANVDIFAGFEPLTIGFLDDNIRSTLLLPQSKLAERLNKFVTSEASLSNEIMDIVDEGSIRGLNPGYAMGELVVRESSEQTEFSSDKIYIFDRPPADLKPVAGIATVTEGNLVSHVQLLARNLGIPNSVISPEIIKELKKYSGRKVFYAVSKGGTVIIKSVDNMTEIEKKLFEKKGRKDERIMVPVDNIEIHNSKLVNLKNLRSTNSGKLCGPKAANLGELKYLFPENVVDGFVIPFGVFKKHLDQQMPGTSGTYWQYLNDTFIKSVEMQKKNIEQGAIDNFTLQKLEVLRTAVKGINLLPEFIKDLDQSFQTILKKSMGDIAVFIRSDTNMEDLKDFTGAGLNLTLFNVVDREKILQGIREVWASPYSERSYKWRQKFLLNPENVYPSLLVIPTVDVDISGVMITKGITSGNDKDITIAFSRGAGGAVEGQEAETYLLANDGENILLSPSRESEFNVLPATGGLAKGISYFKNPILTKNNLNMLRVFSAEIINKLNSEKSSSIGPQDIELGFKDDKVWLFQIRPFVENKNAAKSEYLDLITPEFPSYKKIKLNQKL